MGLCFLNRMMNLLLSTRLLCAEDLVFSLYLAVRYYVSGIYLTARNVLLRPPFFH